GVLAAEVGALEVGVHGLVPDVLGQERRGGVGPAGLVPVVRDVPDAGVVVEDVQAAEGVGRVPDQVFALGLVGHVRPLEGGPAGVPFDVFDRCVATLLVDVGDHHAGALAGEEERRRPTLPAARTGDDGHLAFETRAQVWPPSPLAAPMTTPGAAV